MVDVGALFDSILAVVKAWEAENGVDLKRLEITEEKKVMVSVCWKEWKVERETEGKPLVWVKLNSGTFRGYIVDEGTGYLGKETYHVVEVQLLEHPTLKTVHVRRSQTERIMKWVEHRWQRKS
jgi:hypothetical protein